MSSVQDRLGALKIENTTAHKPNLYGGIYNLVNRPAQFLVSGILFGAVDLGNVSVKIRSGELSTYRLMP